MDERTKGLVGSPSRDKFKSWHKQLSPQLWACDVDFVIVAKDPPDIVAVMDFKAGLDDVTFSEVIAYNAFIRRGLRVFIVNGILEAESFVVREYLGGNHQKPRSEYGPPIVLKDRIAFEEWEFALRKEHTAKWKP